MFPMAKKGDSREAFSLLFQQYGVPPKMIVDSLKDQTMGDLSVRFHRIAVT